MSCGRHWTESRPWAETVVVHIRERAYTGMRPDAVVLAAYVRTCCKVQSIPTAAALAGIGPRTGVDGSRAGMKLAQMRAMGP